MEAEDPGGWLIVLAEVEALRWVLAERRMAFSEGQCRRASAIRPGDELVVYMGRGAFHNPTRDRSQLAALARVTSDIRALSPPVSIAGREFACGCTLEILMSLPERSGVPVQPLVGRLSFVRWKEVWGQYFRAGLVRVAPNDMQVLRTALGQAAVG
ncbi:MAG: hypothetical protein M3Q23_00925 [Actinomycetota bacterium]|nr:hypothetical protein [Actinomycetota bacterium]